MVSFNGEFIEALFEDLTYYESQVHRVCAKPLDTDEALDRLDFYAGQYHRTATHIARLTGVDPRPAC